jgi:activator of HSP90 ATPase
MKTIKQKAIIKNATPSQVYDALMDSKKHSDFTGGKAVMGSKVGDDIMAYDGYITGKNKELIVGKKIVQSWQADGFPEGHYSEITYELNSVDGGCEITFTQTNTPDDKFDDLSNGWKEHYWDKLNKYFSK